MGTGLPRAGASDTTIIAKRGGDQPVSVSSSTGPSRAKGISVVRVGDRFDDPWMRAMIVSPSALEFMRTSLFGTPDFRAFAMFLQKPATVMALSFGKDPHFGMTTERFAGSAVFFVATAPNGGRTAALR